jgi:hypothetical protein
MYEHSPVSKHCQESAQERWGASDGIRISDESGRHLQHILRIRLYMYHDFCANEAYYRDTLLAKCINYYRFNVDMSEPLLEHSTTDNVGVGVSKPGSEA